MSNYIMNRTQHGQEMVSHTLNMLSAATVPNARINLLTTINTKYAQLADKHPTTTPKLLYYGFGINGYHEDGGVRYPYKPLSDEHDLYQPIPFLTVPAGTVLEDGMEDQYRMKRSIVLAGRTYDAYMLKCLDTINAKPRLTKISSIGNAQYEVVDYEQTPNHTPLPNINNNMSRSVDLTATITTTITYTNLRLTVDELANIVAVYYQGDHRKLNLSELGIYSGEDLPLDDGTTEAIGVQLAYKFCDTGYPLANIAKGIQKNIRFASTNRLLL